MVCLECRMATVPRQWMVPTRLPVLPAAVGQHSLQGSLLWALHCSRPAVQQPRQLHEVGSTLQQQAGQQSND